MTEIDRIIEECHEECHEGTSISFVIVLVIILALGGLLLISFFLGATIKCPQLADDVIIGSGPKYKCSIVDTEQKCDAPQLTLVSKTINGNNLLLKFRVEENTTHNVFVESQFIPTNKKYYIQKVPKIHPITLYAGDQVLLNYTMTNADFVPGGDVVVFFENCSEEFIFHIPGG